MPARRDKAKDQIINDLTQISRICPLTLSLLRVAILGAVFDGSHHSHWSCISWRRHRSLQGVVPSMI